MRTRAEGATLTVNGLNEVTSTNASELDDTITGKTTPKIRTIDIDLSAATFLDNTGLRVLINVHQRASRENRRVRLIKPTMNVMEILAFTEQDRTFELVF